MNERNHTLEKAGLSIPKILEEHRLLIPCRLYRVKRDWKDIVGPQIAKYSYVQGVQGDVVCVAVLNSVWMNQLFMYKNKLIDSINAYIQAEAVKDIRFVRRGKKPPRPLLYENLDGLEEEEGPDTKEIQNIVLPKERVLQIRKGSEALPPPLQERMAQLRFAQERQKIWHSSKGWKQCPSCGRWIRQEESLCFLCRLQERQKKKQAVYRVLMQMPWLTWEDMEGNGFVPPGQKVYAELYNEVRRECIYKYIERIYYGCDTPEDDMMLALFITRRNPAEMTDKFIHNLTEKYRRKDHVPSYRRPENG